MLPVFLVDDVTVRESGQSAVFDATESLNQKLTLTLGITHAVERESISVEIHGSKDGIDWPREPLVRFAPKHYCGTYQLTVQKCEARYLKAAWSVKRWSRGEEQPFFGFYVFAERAQARTAAAGAA